jgi:uncharacterized protein (DUF983 family)
MSGTSEFDLHRALRLAGRAVRLRCPQCGGGKIFRSPLVLKAACPTCGLALDRGESDYFLGAYLLNLVAVELLFAAALAVVVMVTWPDPPWNLIQYGGATLMVAGAVLCYPFAKVLWLGIDVALRPVEHEEPPGIVAPPLAPDSPAYRRPR